MPIFEISGPTGKYEVTAPDEASALDAYNKFASSAAQPEKSAPNRYLRDAALSFGAGVRSGVEGIAGTPGDIAKLQGSLVGGAATMLGADEKTGAAIGRTVERFNPLTLLTQGGRALMGQPIAGTDEVRAATDELIGKPYQPQTRPGVFARTFGEFVPGSMIGPGGIGGKLAMAGGSALASETAGQITKGSEIEPYARLAGSVLGGLATGSALNRIANPPKRAVPAIAADDLKAQADKMFADLRASGAYLPGKAAAKVRGNIAMTLSGTNKELAPTAYGLKRQVDRVLRGKQVDIVDFHNLSMQANMLARGNGMTDADAHFVRAIKSQIDAARDTALGGPVNAGALWRQANDLVLRQHKTELVDRALDIAELNTGQYTQAELAHTIAQRFRQLYRSGDIKSFTKEEKAIIRAIGQGQSYSAIIGLLRKAAVRGPVSAMSSAILGSLFGSAIGSPVVGAVAIPAVGEAALRMANRASVNAAEGFRSGVSRGVRPVPIRPVGAVNPLPLIMGGQAALAHRGQ